METKDQIIYQLQQANKFTYNFMDKCGDENWLKTPSVLDTNFAWLSGHIFISNYFHSVISVSGSSEVVKSRLSPKEFSIVFGMGSSAKANQEKFPSRESMKDHLRFLEDFIIGNVEQMNEKNLDEAVLRHNPMAKTKRDALIWSSHHQMWHVGQMSLLLRTFTSL